MRFLCQKSQIDIAKIMCACYNWNMENLTFQSVNVKEYFVHALKSLGVRHEQRVIAGNQASFPEMKEEEIEQLLNNSQLSASKLRDLIKAAIIYQYSYDASMQPHNPDESPEADHYIQRHTALDRQTVKQLLLNLGVDEMRSDAALRTLTAAGVDTNGKLPLLNSGNNAKIDTGFLLDNVVDEVITAIMKGVPEQKISAADKTAANELWGEVLYADFKQFLKVQLGNQYDEAEFDAWKKDKKQAYGMYYEASRLYRLQEQIRAWAQQYGLANHLNDGVKQNTNLWQQIRANDGLLKDSLEFCKKRCEIARIPVANHEDLETNLTLGDILSVAGNEKAHIVTFFQTRSAEQQIQEDRNPGFYESKKENKIGSVLGEQGRKHIKEKTGTGAVIEHDVIKGLKSGKKGPWRGYKALYDRIVNFLDSGKGSIFGDIQAVGLTQSIIEKETGYSFTPEDVKQTKEEESTIANPVQIDFNEEEIPDLHTVQAENVARDFYAKTKARILSDKVTVTTLPEQQVQDGEEETERQKYFREYKAYLQKRIMRGENVLATKMPDPQSPQYNDPAYFARLEEYILAEQDNQSNKLIIGNIHADKTKQANDYMADSIFIFNEAAKEGVAGEKEAAKHAVATQFFNLDSLVQTGKISGRDLDGMTDRFFSQQSVGRMDHDLSNPNGRDVNEMALAAMHLVEQFVVNDLQQNAMRSQYQQFLQEQAAQADRETVKQNAEAQRQAAAQDIGRTSSN